MFKTLKMITSVVASDEGNEKRYIITDGCADFPILLGFLVLLGHTSTVQARGWMMGQKWIGPGRPDIRVPHALPFDLDGVSMVCMVPMIKYDVQDFSKCKRSCAGDKMCQAAVLERQATRNVCAQIKMGPCGPTYDSLLTKSNGTHAIWAKSDPWTGPTSFRQRPDLCVPDNYGLIMPIIDPITKNSATSFYIHEPITTDEYNCGLLCSLYMGCNAFLTGRKDSAQTCLLKQLNPKDQSMLIPGTPKNAGCDRTQLLHLRDIPKPFHWG